jgi:RNA polymerase sigma-70 factor (ECF subfamily)
LNLTDLAQSLQGRLRVLLQRFTYNWATTEDLLQETHIRLLTCTVRNPGAAKAYIYRVALSVLWDWYRRERRSRLEFHQDLSDFVRQEGGGSPERLAIIRQELENAILILPPRCRRAFQLVKCEGYSYKEAAREMNITPKTLHTHLRDALLLLRRALRENGDV